MTFGIILGIIIAAFVAILFLLPKPAVATDAFAQCLANEGAVMYGAYWCHACQAQKNLFGSSFQYVNYVECDPQGDNANPQLCQEKEVDRYPTWYVNNVKYVGVQQLNRLGELAGCPLTI